MGTVACYVQQSQVMSDLKLCHLEVSDIEVCQLAQGGRWAVEHGSHECKVRDLILGGDDQRNIRERHTHVSGPAQATNNGLNWVSLDCILVATV